MLKSGYFLLLLLFSCSTLADVELVKVDKSKRRMYLIDDGQVIREFRIALANRQKGTNSRKAINVHRKAATTSISLPSIPTSIVPCTSVTPICAINTTLRHWA